MSLIADAHGVVSFVHWVFHPHGQRCRLDSCNRVIAPMPMSGREPVTNLSDADILYPNIGIRMTRFESLLSLLSLLKLVVDVVAYRLLFVCWLLLLRKACASPRSGEDPEAQSYDRSRVREWTTCAGPQLRVLRRHHRARCSVLAYLPCLYDNCSS